jgi:predicted transposase/invertase (TIGR01784 family)
MKKQPTTNASFNNDSMVSFLTDYGFKKIFADESDTEFVRKTIQCLLNEKKPIEKLTLLRNEFTGLTEISRSGLYDVKLQDENYRIFIAEMQSKNYDFFLERVQFYAFHTFNSSVTKGRSGFMFLPPIICICFVEDSINASNRYHHKILFKNDDNEVMMQNIEIHLIEFGKFPFKKDDFEKIVTEKEEILYTMKYAHTINPNDKVSVPLFFKKKPYISTALEKLDTSKMSPSQRADLEFVIADQRAMICEQEYRDMKLAESITKEVTEKVTQKVSAKVTKEVSAKVTKEVSAKVTKEVSAKVTKEVSAKVNKEAAIKLKKEKEFAVKNLLKLGILSDSQIAESIGVSIEYVEKLKKNA